MIHDIKVFDKHGNLKKIINGKKYFDKLYSETAKSFIVERKKTKSTFICKYCNTKVEQTRTSKVTCGSRECRNAHARAYKRNKVARKITCRICKTELEVTQSRQVTCSKKCSEENNRRTSLAGARRRQKYSGVWDRKRRELECQK